jgi:quercetin dioxygenase-like cupin family protein
LEIQTLRDFFKFSTEKLFKNPIFESPHLFFDIYGILPGQAQKVHAHADSDKIYCVLEGEAWVTVGDCEHTLLAGQAVLAAAGVAHGIKNESLAPAAVLVVMAPKP